MRAAIAAYLGDDPRATDLFAAVAAAITLIGPADIVVSKSQIAFRRKRAFAWVWRPGRYLRGEVAPLVLSVALATPDPSPRWKEVVTPAPEQVMHHLELWQGADLDAEVADWLRQAWDQAA